MSTAMYSQSFAQDSDVLLGAEKLLQRKDGLILSKFSVIAGRNVMKADFYIEVDWTEGLDPPRHRRRGRDHAGQRRPERSGRGCQLQPVVHDGSVMLDLLPLLEDLGIQGLRVGAKEISGSAWRTRSAPDGPTPTRRRGRSTGETGAHICYSCGFKGGLADVYRAVGEAVPED